MVDAFTQRALTAASLYGVLPKDPRENVIVTTAHDDAALESAFQRAAPIVRERNGVFAILAASKSAVGVSTAAPHAPPIEWNRVQQIVTSAEAVDFALVEPEIAAFKGIPIAAGRSATATDRAVFALVLLGSLARPLIFVSKSNAPKNGLPKVREERLLDGWIRSLRPTAGPASLTSAAFEILARDRDTPMRGKDLLREARGLFGKTSTSDSATLARDLYNAWLFGEVELYAVEPYAVEP